MLSARVVKSVDTRDLKSLARKGVPVQVRPRAPLTANTIAVGKNHAGIAQLVERYLAKVEVTSSSLVARSKLKQKGLWKQRPFCFCGKAANAD
jgi:hypothetical protein